MKIIIGLFTLLLAVVGGIVLSQNYFKENGQLSFLKSAKATVNNHTFSLLIARSAAEKEAGLTSKTSLPQGSGMLFLFDKAGDYSFWMKNMKFPIDIIYIDKDKVVTVYENLQPAKSKNESIPVFTSNQPADKVLEINAGLSKKYSIKKGDMVKIEGL